MDTSVVLGLCGLFLSAATFFLGRISAAKSNGQSDGEMHADIKYIKSSVEKQEKKLDELTDDSKNVKLEVERLWGEFKALKQRVNMLHGE